ncbi:MAG: dienelactone hydrolase family protein [Candidatus Binatia bacterium]|nr:dienelactone hydrolase family protein [Candidatus Binatia bacterium]
MTLESRRFDDGKGGYVSAVIAYPDGFVAGRAPLVILAHGAGNDMTHPLLSAVHEGLAMHGYPCIKFNFPYTEQGRRAPDPEHALETCYRSIVAAVRAEARLRPSGIVIGGKSLGGRIASQLVAQGTPVDGLLFLGYPLHPPGKPEQVRIAHLTRIQVPMLFFAGTRDPFCTLDLLRQTMQKLTAPTTLHVIADGDHSFAIRKRTGRTQREVYEEIVTASAAWLRRTLTG